MGVITNCCSRQSITQGSSISIYSLEEDTKDNELPQNEKMSISDEEHALKFITSKDYYSLLLKKVPKHKIAKNICLKLDNAKIFSLINKLFQWILQEEFNNCDENSKNKINLIKTNAKISLNYLLKELKNIKFSEGIDIYILQGLTSLALIAQCLLFLSNKTEDNEFKLCIWDNKNIVDEAKNYGFQAAYFFCLIKKKYEAIKNNNSNFNDDNKITNKKKEEFNAFYKISINYANDLINS